MMITMQSKLKDVAFVIFDYWYEWNQTDRESSGFKARAGKILLFLWGFIIFIFFVFFNAAWAKIALSWNEIESRRNNWK